MFFPVWFAKYQLVCKVKLEKQSKEEQIDLDTLNIF